MEESFDFGMRPRNQSFATGSDEEEDDFDHQYDDYEDLFSNETDSVISGMYLETDPGMQREVAQLIMLKRHLDSLQQKLHEKEFGVQRAREELHACRVRMKALKEERESVEKNILLAKERDNMASYHRLLSKCEKLNIEIDAEQKLEVDIQARLQEAELAQSRVEIEQRHYSHLAEKVIEKEEKVTQHKEKMARYRFNKEQHIAKTAAKRHERAQRALQQKFEEKNQRQHHIIESAILNHEKAKVFLKESLTKIQDQEMELNEMQQLDKKRRMETIIGLKNSVASNRENLKALQARDAAFDKKDKAAEKLERHQVLNEGGNPEQVLLRRKKLKEFEKEKVDFEAKQKVNKARIVASILNEERNISRRKKQQPHLWPDKHREKAKELGPPPKPSIHSKIELNEKDEPIFLQQVKYMKQTPREDIQREVLSEASSSDIVSAHPKSSSDHRLVPHPPEEQEESLAQPEFQGLWEQKHKMYKIPKDEVAVKPVGGTKMEQAILQKTLTKHREGIIVKQVAAGREFKGQPFYSKPDIIHFKDLDVGRTYKKKIVITNVSYSINFLKLTGLSEHLKDFIKIEFNPPGQMSAGMSCDMTVTFKPMINEDLIGEVFFMAQTGPFTIPLKCTTKKCDLSVDVTSIDFGSQVVGETIRRSVTLVNKGALGTRFDFQKVPEKPATTYTLETSLGRLTTAETPGVTNDDSYGMKATPNPETGARSKRPPVSEGMPQTADRSFKISEFPDGADEDYDDGTEYGQPHYGRAEGDEITFATPATEYQTMAEELKVGEVMSGEIEPFSSVRLDIVFAPCIPGDIQAAFRVSFSDPESAPLEIKASAVAIHVPVWLERQNIDLKICMYDRLYQDQIVVHNRASTALRLNFEVPRELRSHLELLPKTGYIQAKSTFTAQLKFLPRKNLAEDAGGLFDPGTGILESPLVVRVAEQTRPVEFVVNAVVTSSDLEFDRVDIDFGHCGIYESVVSTVKLTNHSILPQLFGFVNIPEYVDVQPNDGFGTILPLETIEIDIIVETKRARVYDFTLTCRSGINRDFPIHCRAVGVHPPLDLSHQVIHFAATALDDVSTALLHVVNAHTSANEFTHPVPRTGKGEIVPVGPTSFEFVVPEDAPIFVTPCVGTVKPGEKCHVTLEFAPKLSDADVRKEAVHVMQEQREEKAREEQERIRREQEELVARQQEEEKAVKGKKTPKTPSKPKTGDSSKSAKSSAKSAEKLDQPLPTPEMIDENSTAYKAAAASLTRSYPGNFRSFTIPCFVATGSCSDSVEPSTLNFNNANTLYLEVHCPTIKPPVVIISNHGHNLTDFGQVSIGQNTIKPISIQNISDHPIELTLSVLDTNGPFQVLNALRMLKPDETHTLLVSFTPTAGKVFYEVLKIVSTSSVLDVCLTGKGVTPVIHLSPEGGAIDMGHVLEGETSQSMFTLENKSSLAVKYSIRMDSASLLKHENQQQLPEFIRRDGRPAKALVGPQNYNGSCVFDCVPCEGEIKTGETHEIEITFNPDHESRHFSDGARIVLFNTEEAHVIHVTGKGHDHMMYVEGNDPLDVAVESLAIDRKPVEEAAEALAPAKNILLSFTSHVSDEGFTEAIRTLVIGCLKSNAFAGRKNGEWIVDNVQSAQSKGFVADPLKGTVDVDGTKDLTFTWNPPENHDPSTPVETSVLLTLKGDVTMTYNVILTGLVSFK